MNAIIKGKWFFILGWVVVIVLLVTTAPKMNPLVREKGQITVPGGYSSSDAQKLLDEMHKKDKTGNSSQLALVFHSNNKITKEQMDNIKQGLSKLRNQKTKLGITNITSPLDDPSLKSKLISKDGKTILTSIEVEKGNRSSKQMTDALYKPLKQLKISHYYTGGSLIDEDLITSSQEGLHKTEYLTIIFILAVLFIVFRSIVAPVIPLIAVGITYIVSQSIVAFLVDRVNFPLSTFTQIFLVAVLFGIGTDYCILLLSRFKEELSHRNDVIESIIVTYRNAGRTVLFSGLAVLIGFAAIGLSTFKLYQSGAAVAIGVAVLLLSLFTLVPFFMALLGKHLFWPSKKSLEHKQSRLWGYAGRFTFLQPILSLAIVAVVTVPFLIIYNGALSFNNLDEIGNHYNSVKGFNIIAQAFGPGESMPTQVVMKNDISMNSPEYLGLIEKISREVAKVNGVKTVRSATRPTGDPLNDFLVTKQAASLKGGLNASHNGMEKIGSGLNNASTSLKNSEPKLNKATDSMGALVKGTNDLKSGVTKLSSSLSRIESGMKNGASGSDQIKQGLEKAKQSAQTLAKNSKKLEQGYEQMSSSLGELDQNYGSIQQGLTTSITGISRNLQTLAKSHLNIATDPNFQAAFGTTQFLLNGDEQTPSPLASFQKLNNGLAQLKGALDEANTGFVQISGGESKLTDGLNQLVISLGQLEDGLNKAANGQGQVIDSLPRMKSGLSGIAKGQKQIQNGFKQLNNQMGQLTDGLDKSVNGLKTISNGLGSAKDYLKGLSNATDKQLAGWYIPKEAMNNKDFQTAINHYMSKDHKTVTFDVIFKTNPYSAKTLDKIAKVLAAVHRATKGTKLENAKVGVGGVTSINTDLRAISKADYSRTVVLMLIGIAVILIGLLRSLIMPLYIIGSLVLTYFTALGASEVIFVHILGYTGLSWSVPFFAFVMLIALGVDYSIFLMDRFNEYMQLPIEQAMILSMKNMGTVILSAALILGGTFAAMIPSGVLSLMEIATIIIIGLILYAVIILPLFIPLMVRTFGVANWWPFPKEQSKLDNNTNVQA